MNCTSDKPIIIGVTPSVGENGRLMVNADYMNALVDAGACPVLLAMGDEKLIRSQLSFVNGVLLTGGADVDPERYGETVRPECGELSRERDAFEFPLAKMAVEMDLPVLGICRGQQIVNAAYGGTLYQDIDLNWHHSPAFQGEPIFHPRYQDGYKIIHQVQMLHCDDTSLLYRAVSAGQPHTETLDVNSSHHQSVCKVAPGFTVEAVSPDGVIESVSMRGRRFVLCVQWHPERLYTFNQDAKNIFRAFVNACR